MNYDVSVFGGAGFVGHALARRLVETDYRVTVVDNLSTEPASDLESFPSIPPSKTPYTFVKGDVRAPVGDMEWERVFGHLAEGTWTIVWLPAVQGYTRTIDQFGENNVCPIFNLFEAIRHYGAEKRIRRIVLASSQAVYSPGKNLTEGVSATDPISVYGVSKLAQEHVMLNLARLFGISVYSMRYSVILGKGQSPASLESGVMRNWVRAYKKRLGPEVYGAGLHVRDFVHIDDVTDANVRAIESDRYVNDAFNVAGFSCSVIDLAYMFQEVCSTNVDGDIPFQEPRVLGNCPRDDGGIHDFTSSSLHAAEVLNYEPERDLVTQVTDSFKHFNALIDG